MYACFLLSFRANREREFAETWIRGRSSTDMITFKLIIAPFHVQCEAQSHGWIGRDRAACSVRLAAPSCQISSNVNETRDRHARPGS